MWKTRDGWPAASERHQLCPECDSLGPHDAVSDEPPWDAWLQCIDCGTHLGRLTPEGIEGLDEDPLSACPPSRALEPSDVDLLNQLVERTRQFTREPDPARSAFLVAARARLELTELESSEGLS